MLFFTRHSRLPGTFRSPETLINFITVNFKSKDYFPNLNNYNYQYNNYNQVNMPYNIDEKKKINLKGVVED